MFLSFLGLKWPKNIGGLKLEVIAYFLGGLYSFIPRTAEGIEFKQVGLRVCSATIWAIEALAKVTEMKNKSKENVVLWPGLKCLPSFGPQATQRTAWPAKRHRKAHPFCRGSNVSCGVLSSISFALLGIKLLRPSPPTKSYDFKFQTNYGFWSLQPQKVRKHRRLEILVTPLHPSELQLCHS